MFHDKFVRIVSEEGWMGSVLCTYLVISASDNVVFDRIGMKTLPRKNAIRRDNACKKAFEIIVKEAATSHANRTHHS
jgi:hypothetical protein